jgi:hypothetical protein
MKKRDAATGRRYCILQNEVLRLVRRDKQYSNLLSLQKACNNPKVLWSLTDQALGKDCPSLPASITGANGPTTTYMVMRTNSSSTRWTTFERRHYSLDCRRRSPTLMGRFPTPSRRPAKSRRMRPTLRRRSTTSGRRPTTTPCPIATSPASTSISRTRRGLQRR